MCVRINGFPIENMLSCIPHTYTRTHTHTLSHLLCCCSTVLPFSRYIQCMRNVHTYVYRVYVYVHKFIYTIYAASAHIWVFHSVLFCSVRFIDELSSMCATEFRSVNDVISTYIYNIVLNRKIVIQSSLTYIQSFVRAFARSLTCSFFHSVLCFICPQFIGIIAFSVYGFMCSLCMYACATRYAHCILYAPICVPTRLCVHNILYRRYALTVFAFILTTVIHTFSICTYGRYPSVQPCVFIWYDMICDEHRLELLCTPHKNQKQHNHTFMLKCILQNREWKRSQ